MEVVVGTYEELVLGYKLQFHKKDCVLQTSFTDHSHTGCVRCVAISENGFLASGSSDESIRLFNLKKRTEVGSLVHHNGYISGLTFFGKSHLFSCSADGTIGIWRVGKWECEKILRGHKDAVLSVSVHPTGKLALSISHNKMRTWNLLTGKCAYITSIKNGDIVRWSPDGKLYIVVSRDVVHIYSTETAELMSSPKFGFRINCVHFVKNHLLVVGGEGGSVQFYDLEKKLVVHQLETGTIRVKDMNTCEVEGHSKLVTGSSDGYIKVWNVTQTEGKWKTTLEASVDSKFRIVSLAVRATTRDTVSFESASHVERDRTVEHETQEGDSDSLGEFKSGDSDGGLSDSSDLMDDVQGSEQEEEEKSVEETNSSKPIRAKGTQRRHQKHGSGTTKRKEKQQVARQKHGDKIEKSRSENNSTLPGKTGKKNKVKNLQKKKQLKKMKLKGMKQKHLKK